MSMNADQENFEPLRRLLALKKHEQPPPGYFKDFSQQVIMQIRAAGPEAQVTGAERLIWQAPWLQRFWAALENNPVLAGGFGVIVCALLISGVIYSENTGRGPETAGIEQPTEQSGAQLGMFADGSAISHPLLVQPAAATASGFSSAIGAPVQETRGSLFDEFRNSQAQDRVKPVLFNLPEGN